MKPVWLEINSFSLEYLPLWSHMRSHNFFSLFMVLACMVGLFQLTMILACFLISVSDFLKIDDCSDFENIP